MTHVDTETLTILARQWLAGEPVGPMLHDALEERGWWQEPDWRWKEAPGDGLLWIGDLVIAEVRWVSWRPTTEIWKYTLLTGRLMASDFAAGVYAAKAAALDALRRALHT